MFTDLANPKIEHKGKTKNFPFSIKSVQILYLKFKFKQKSQNQF